MIGCVEFDRVPIRVGEGRGDRAFCQSRYFRKNVAHSVGVEVPVCAGIQQFADPEHLEQIELDITHVAFVVTIVLRPWFVSNTIRQQIRLVSSTQESLPHKEFSTQP